MSNLLEYSNATHSNIIPQSEFEELVREVFDTIATNLSRSLGPLGSSATILDGAQTDATKDGYTIFKNYRFHNRYKKMIYNLIKEPCQKMNNTVGDGTSTAIALTNAIFHQWNRSKDYLYSLYRLPRQFTQAWDEVIGELKRRIPEKSTPIDPEDYDTIYNIAYVTSNGSDEISRTIAETYKAAKSPFIRQKDSPTNKSYISKINGFDFPANLIGDIYVKNQDLTAEEKNIRVMIIDHKVETDTFNSVIRPINEVLRAKGEKLLVLASYYDEYLCSTILEQYVTMEYRTQKNGINLIMAQYALGKLDPYQLSDLAIILRAKIINQDLMAGLTRKMDGNSPDAVVESILNDETYEFYRLIGIAENALLSCNTGSLFKVTDIESDEKYQETLARAKKDLEDIISQTDNEKQSYAAKIHDANSRLMQLQMNNYIYYIGADSGLQKRITWDSVEDVIKCVRSAVRSGVVPGCQLTILSSCLDYLKETSGSIEQEEKMTDDVQLKREIVGIIYRAVCEVYQLVLHGPDNMGIIKTLPRWNTTKEEGIDDLIKEAREKGLRIINESIEKNQVFDMATLEFNPNIITSAETDSMVLTAASELIKILISGNQCIFLDADVDSSHQEEVQTYV